MKSSILKHINPSMNSDNTMLQHLAVSALLQQKLGTNEYAEI